MSEKTISMTREEVMASEHKIQTGESSILPDGRTVSEAWQENLKLQTEQAEKLAERGEAQRGRDNFGGFSQKSGEDFLKEQVEVRVAKTGAVSASRVETEIAARAAAESPARLPANDLPEDFPMRDALYAAGANLSVIKTLNKESLVELKGIGDAAAEKILDYGKAE